MVEENSKNNSKYMLVLVAIVAIVAIVDLFMMSENKTTKIYVDEIPLEDNSDENDLAGQAIKGTFEGITKDQQKQLQKLAADTTSCAVKPDGYIIKNADKTQSLCIDMQAKICNLQNSGQVQNVDDKFDALCFEVFGWFRWAECNTDNQIEKKGDNAVVSSAGTTITAGNHDYLCNSFNINGKSYESWIGCNENFA